MCYSHYLKLWPKSRAFDFLLSFSLWSVFFPPSSPFLILFSPSVPVSAPLHMHFNVNSSVASRHAAWWGNILDEAFRGTGAQGCLNNGSVETLRGLRSWTKMKILPPRSQQLCVIYVRHLFGFSATQYGSCIQSWYSKRRKKPQRFIFSWVKQ